VPPYALRRLHRRLLQTLAAAAPASGPAVLPPADLSDRFLAPFWCEVTSDESAALVAQAPPDPAMRALLDAVLQLRTWAEAHQRGQAFWQALWTMLPTSALGRIRFGRTRYDLDRDDTPPWRRLLAPLLELRHGFGPADVDVAMFGTDLRLTRGLDYDAPAYLPCPGALRPLADEIVHYEECEDEGLPDWPEEEFGKDLGTLEAEWEAASGPVRAQRCRMYNGILARVRGESAADDCLRAYCHHCLHLGNGLASLYADRAFTRAPDDRYMALMWLRTLTAAALRRGAPPSVVLSQPVFAQREETWYDLAGYCSAVARPDLAIRYLRALHHIWPWDPATTSMLGILARRTGDADGQRHWQHVTARLDGEYGLFFFQIDPMPPPDE
jgi:hypothetical protein